jgi:transcriptional regulator with XRE-family HTH domain
MSDDNIHDMETSRQIFPGKASSDAGKCIRALRLSHGWSQEDVASKMGISVPAFSKIETGVTDVNLSRLEQIARVYNVSIAQLFGVNDRQDDRMLAQSKILHSKLAECDSEILELQRKVIELLEAVYNKR